MGRRSSRHGRTRSRQQRRTQGYIHWEFGARFPDADGQLEGHDAAFATVRGISYFVSIHGHTHDDGDIAMLLAVLAQAQ